MAVAAVQHRDESLAVRLPTDDRHGWGLALLLAVVATLFIRPADLLPSLDQWPIYQFLIVVCLIVSARAVVRQLSYRQLSEQAVTVCLLVLLLSVAASHLSHGRFWSARMASYEVGKLIALYLLIVALINTPRRLALLIRLLVLGITVVAMLVLVDRAGIVPIAALEPVRSHVDSSATADLVDRVRGTGIFQDPNDFGLILVTGLVLTASFLLRPGSGWIRYLWLGPAITLLTTFAMTHSRGAFISLACGVAAVPVYRRGWRAAAASFVCLPLLAILLWGRMTDFTAVNEGTGQSRIQAWSDSLVVFQQYPIFGLGRGLLVEEQDMVTHNSFLHCFAELGIVGGTAFLGCFLAAALGLWSQRHACEGAEGSNSVPDELQELAHVRVYVFAALVAYSAGIVTLSRQFVTPTYLILGLAVATASLQASPPTIWRFKGRFLAFSLLASALTLLAFHVAVRLFVHWQ